jgi:hypothetical protein
MARVDYRLTLADDRSKVRLENVVDGKVEAWADVEAPELDSLIHLLLSARAQLLHEVPRVLDHGSRLPTIVDPAWQAPTEFPEGYRAVALRHPGSGWTMFEFPDREARAIAKALAP